MEVLSSAAITAAAGSSQVRHAVASEAAVLIDAAFSQKVLIIHHHVPKCHETHFRWQKPSQPCLTLRDPVSRTAVVVGESRLSV